MARPKTPPVCDVVCVHTDTVEALQPAVRNVIGAGEVLSFLADDTRFRVLYALSRSELCVCDVAAIIESTTAVASYHLRLLYRAGLTTYRREGKLVYYALADPDMRSLIEAVLAYVHKDDAH